MPGSPTSPHLHCLRFCFQMLYGKSGLSQGKKGMWLTAHLALRKTGGLSPLRSQAAWLPQCVLGDDSCGSPYTSLQLLFWTIFPGILRSNWPWEIKIFISLQDRGQVCLLSPHCNDRAGLLAAPL